MPRKLTPEEAAVMIIRRRLRQMEEDKMAKREPEAQLPESGEEEPQPVRDGAKESDKD
ncbi:MAG: winged-helix domain-containing protein [Burkholderiales bacterium]|jgi:hypothetical protein